MDEPLKRVAGYAARPRVVVCCRRYGDSQGDNGDAVGFFHRDAGGMGTLDRLFELLTPLQPSFHNRPIGLLNVLTSTTGLSPSSAASATKATCANSARNC